MAINRYKGKEAASKYLLSKLQQHPSLQGLYQLLECKSSIAENDEKTLLTEMKNAVHKMQKDHTDYQCRHCGFQANTLYWLCPSCHSWSQIKPTLIDK